jgi:hypothetical protein
MKNILKNYISLCIFLSMTLFISSCSDDDLESDASKVIPIVSDISGEAVGFNGLSNIYTLTPYRGGSDYIWSVTNADIAEVEGRTDQIEVIFTQSEEPVTLSVYELATNGKTSESISTEITVFGTPCNWTVEMQDSYGDGWNDASITLTFEGVELGTYTLDSGSSTTHEVAVPDGGDFTVSFTSGAYDSEVTYQIYDPSEGLIFEDGPTPEVGDVYTATNTCADY